MWGDPKIPGFVKKNYLKYLYEFETLVPFDVLALRLDAAFQLKIFRRCFQHWERCWD